jgi:DNA-binding winged helix-turn-helix (wHTH) protein
MSTANQSPKERRPEGTNNSYEFGPFVLDTVRHLLLKGLQPVALTPKTYDMLLVLLESGGRLLSKEELLKALWPNSFVEESNLTQQVSTIRKALGESPGEDRYIVTVAGRGYRFAAPVKARSKEHSDAAAEVSSQRSGQSDNSTGTESAATTAEWPLRPPGLPDSPTPQSGVPRLLQRSRLALWLPVSLAIALMALGYAIHQSQSIGKQSAPRPRSLAILPFRNLRQDADSDFLGFSLADAIVSKLTYISALSVRPSSAVEKYRNLVIDTKKAASDLNVDTLLTGMSILFLPAISFEMAML